jgi:peptide/nickel transport system permease protein
MELQGTIRKRHKFMRNKPAVFGLLYIIFCILISLGGPLIRPDASQHANDQYLELACLKPGSQQIFYLIKPEPEVSSWQIWWQGGKLDLAEKIPFDSITYRSHELLFGLFDEKGMFRQHAIFSTSERGMDSQNAISTSKQTFLLGTDKYGRDVLSRLMAGTYISLSVGAIAVVISIFLGVFIGVIAGYYKGWVDTVLMWFTHVIWSIPTLLLVMAITFVFGTGFWKVFLAVGLTMWVEVARIARGQVLSVREKEYIEAARAMGFSDMRIMWKHILPNITSPIIVISAANFASAILIEAGLSFLGLGAQIPVPSWGNMIREHYSFITTDMAYLALAPGICIMLLVLAFMLVGNGLRDALDVKR